MCVGASGFQPRIDIWHHLVFLATGFQRGHEPLTTCDSTEHSQLLLVHLIKHDFTFKNLFSIATFDNQGPRGSHAPRWAQGGLSKNWG